MNSIDEIPLWQKNYIRTKVFAHLVYTGVNIACHCNDMDTHTPIDTQSSLLYEKNTSPSVLEKQR